MLLDREVFKEENTQSGKAWEDLENNRTKEWSISKIKANAELAINPWTTIQSSWLLLRRPKESRQAAHWI